MYGHVHQIYIVLGPLVPVKVFFGSSGTLPFNFVTLPGPHKAQSLTVIDTHTLVVIPHITNNYMSLCCAPSLHN